MTLYGLRGIVVTMEDGRILRDGAVIIDSEEGVIVEVGSPKLIEEYKPEITLGGEHSIVMPGLINTHTHSPMSILRGMVLGVSGSEWLKRVWRIEGYLKPEDVYVGTLLSICCMIRSGTTTFADHYFYAEEIARAVKESGIRAVIAKTTIEYSDSAPKHSLKDVVEFALNFRGEADGRISTMIGVHSLYSCSLETVKEAIDKSVEHNIPIHIHLAESIDEIKYIKEKYSTTPIKLADEIGLLKSKPLIAHAAYVQSAEIPHLAKHSVKVAYAPFTKMRGGQEIAPIVDMIRAGISVSLATDGPLSNGDLDMFKEMKFMLAAQNARYRSPAAIMPEDVVKAATINAARNLGLDTITGSLKRGKRADVIVLSPSMPKVWPLTDIYYTIVYSLCSNDVASVFVDGKPLMVNNMLLTVDEEKAIKEASSIVNKLYK